MNIRIVALLALLTASAHAGMNIMSEPAAPLAGTVAETMEGGRYTYLLVDDGSQKHWVATEHLDVKAGDKVTVNGGNLMPNFSSPTLNRTFDEILFAEDVLVGTNTPREVKSLPKGHPPVDGSQHGDAGTSFSGEIAETVDAANYTYIKVTSPDRTLWVATGKFDAKVGQKVTVPAGMVMKNFESPTLGRTFDEILFADEVIPGDGLASAHPAPAASAAQPADTKLAPPPAGLAISEVHRQRTELAGKKVSVRGRVVKFTSHVMGKNWVHLRDGSAEGDDGELTVTTLDTTAVGKVVTASGVISIDEDFGYSYKYPVLLHDASLQE